MQINPHDEQEWDELDQRILDTWMGEGNPNDELVTSVENDDGVQGKATTR